MKIGINKTDPEYPLPVMGKRELLRVTIEDTIIMPEDITLEETKEARRYLAKAVIHMQIGRPTLCDCCLNMREEIP